jgi:hypothetical protein
MHVYAINRWLSLVTEEKTIQQTQRFMILLLFKRFKLLDFAESMRDNELLHPKESEMKSATYIFVLVLAVPSLGQTISYEASSLFPERDGWTHIIQPYQADRWLDNGCLVQVAELVSHGKVVEGEDDPYYREFPEQAGLPSWYLQFRVITDSPPLYQDVGPAAIAAGGFSGVLYHFIIGNNQIRFLRDVALPYVYVNVESGIPHTYRLELRPNSYILYVDGVSVDAGIPEGPYPVTSSSITFRGKASTGVNITRWDYVRFGQIPIDHSGDFDSNAAVDANDLYFFVDCLLSPAYDAAGPGCKWADMNNDGVANGADVSAFVAAMMS